MPRSTADQQIASLLSAPSGRSGTHRIAQPTRTAVKHGLQHTSPARFVADREVSHWFASWCAMRRIGPTELHGELHATLAHAQGKLSGAKPLSFVDVAVMSADLADDLLADFRAWRQGKA